MLRQENIPRMSIRVVKMTAELSRGSLKLLIPESRDSLPEGKVVKKEGKIIKFSI